ncbi:sodium-dependent transporter [Legionella israelensis]|uniref:Sodium:neurotransmitter symporter family protein n=1 Tax=Legionella israelensis TaxID=454 RepID=A0A0W0W8M7_9GAMM|nr:sodium-dependent transporter [Legionella israelensis]KTD28700.1 Sodium:neurotransmitter symporter family protein [Legionella israelensis]QBS08766.1 sodium-dependent transporter [Legionella israelensis]SCY49022.1 neurotransmitter:Na+ symporter, NSS family [Legionella israelensis DSM 19235]STX58443.1 Na+-dependent transporters of the SNF family [Legionella israelensis]
MNNKFQTIRAQWDSNLDYLLVTIGSVIGLGNIFLFPFFVAKFGPLFIVFFLLFELLISIPVVLSEFFIGRRGKQNPVGAISLLAMESGANYRWRWIGWICFTILVLTLGYYCLHTSSYFYSLIEELLHFKSNPAKSSVTISPANSAWSFFYFLIFLAMTMAVVVKGINRGLEKISRIVVPFFFVLFGILAVYASFTGDFKAAWQYLLQFNGEISGPLIVSALIYAFFKLNTAMGTMVVYGSYLPPTTRLGKSTLIIAGFDLLASLLSYFIIFPLLFAHIGSEFLSQFKLETTLNTFLQIPGGFWFASFFLLGTILASWMPAIAFAESATVTLIERASLKRITSTALITMVVIIIGILMLWLPEEWSMEEITLELAEQILTPISALLIALFAGWVIGKETANIELDFGKKLFGIWRFLIRYLVPVCIVIVFTYLLWI